MKGRFSKSFIKYFCVLFFIFMIFIGLRYSFSVQEIEMRIDDDVENYFQIVTNRMTSIFDERQRDLVYIRDMSESLMHHGAKMDQISGLFLEFSKAMGIYDQIRYIDLAGDEIIRINYDDGSPRIVSQPELQNKLDRYYFQALQELDHEGIYISPLDLNVEKGEIEIPFKPMVRMGMQIQNESGIPMGYVIFNYLAANWLPSEFEYETSFRDHVIEFSEMRIVNREGYYLIHENEEKEWGFIVEERGDETFLADYPEVWALRADGKLIKQENAHAIVYLLKNEEWSIENPYHGTGLPTGYLVYEFPKERYGHFFDGIREIGLWMMGVAFLMALLGAYFFEHTELSRREMIDSLHHRAERDELTGLLNKSGFLAMVPSERKRWSDGTLAVGYFDIDDFKLINDTYGHGVGDEVLIEMGNRLQEVLRDRDLPARIHGDEFNILLKLRKKIDAKVVSRRLINRMNDPIETSAGSIRVTVSLGIAFIHEGESFKDVAERADRLMYEVKRLGKSDYRIEGLASETEE